MNPLDNPIPLEKLNQMKTTRESMLNDENAMENMDKKRQYNTGITIICIAGLIIMGIYLAGQHVTISTLKSKRYNDSVTIESLKANLTMPQEIRKFNQLNK